MERVIRVMAHLYAEDGHERAARLPRRDAVAAGRPPRRAMSALRERFAASSSRSPGYVAGAPAGKAPGVARRRGNRPARLERVAVGPARGGHRGDRPRRGGGEPLPGPERRAASPADRRAVRDRAVPDRGRERLLRDPARRGAGAVRARRRDRLRLAGVLDLPLHGAALGRARDPGPARRGLDPRPRRDARRDHRGDQARPRLQPEQPDLDPRPGRARSPRSSTACPATSRCSSTRRTSSSSSTTTPTRPSTCASSSRTSSCCGRSRRSTASPGCGSATRSARRSSAPPSTPSASRSRSTRSPRRRPPRRSSTATTSRGGSSRRSSSGSGSRRAFARSASRRRTRTRTSPGSRSATPTRPRSSPALAERGILVRPGTPLGGPGPHPRLLRDAEREPALPRRARRDRPLAAVGGEVLVVADRLRAVAEPLPAGLAGERPLDRVAVVDHPRRVA